MSYAQGRVINDADSHIMELPDFLKAYADPDMGDVIPRLPVPTVGALAAATAVIGSGVYSLNPVYRNNFTADNNISPEIIFAVPTPDVR